MYSKLSVFDFDGTLINTPEPTEKEKKVWEVVNDKEWPFIGWWGRPESLDLDVWPMEPKPEVLEAYKKEMSDPNTMVVLLTGRLEKLRPQVQVILDKNNFDFDAVLLNRGGNTLIDKIGQMNNLLKSNPSIKKLEMWDDREEHFPKFKSWGGGLDGIGFNINLVK
tara:strand:- start:1109 stop:1603 length:495 start_codon:yes stop_codon:yes gene_type:complete